VPSLWRDRRGRRSELEKWATTSEKRSAIENYVTSSNSTGSVRRANRTNPDTVDARVLNVYPIEFARHFGVRAFVTDRSGGVSPTPYDSLNLGDHVGDEPANVLENRRRVADAIGVDANASSSSTRSTVATS